MPSYIIVLCVSTLVVLTQNRQLPVRYLMYLRTMDIHAATNSGIYLLYFGRDRYSINLCGHLHCGAKSRAPVMPHISCLMGLGSLTRKFTHVLFFRKAGIPILFSFWTSICCGA